MMTEERTAKFLPFHAINEFMTDEFRLEIIRCIIDSFDSLSSENQSRINRMIKKLVKIPGFRNSQKAPASLKIREMVPVFKKNPAFVAEILSAWSSLQGELNQKIAVFLTQRGWEILPTDADRTRLPGFMTVWPEGDDFESLTKAFHQHYPEDHFEENDISLMIVWQSTRLPYETSSDLFSHKSGEETTDPSGAASLP